uniref:Ubiquitin thioesterase OTU n=1 Tax=Amblyomma triste TaxID=251400 RepID=A0A023GBD8_AMBTT
MASSPLVLRVKSAQGQFRLDTLCADSTVEELLGCLFSLTGVPPASTRLLLSDVPPRPLDTSDPLRRLDALPLRSGDTLIVEARRDQNTAAAAAAAPQKAKEHHKERKEHDKSQKHRLDQKREENKEQEEEPLPGVLVKRPVPADNSCLFTSVYLALSGGEYDAGAGAALRQLIADCVAADRETYTEAFLGRPNREYCTWILNEEHWGGAIELSVLSRHYGVEMVAVDAQSGRLHRFGADARCDQRLLLLYDGIHYDPLVLEPLEPGRPVRTLFSAHEDALLALALELAQEARASRQFTDVANFTLRCLACDVGLVGQEAARRHAAETGHLGYGEVSQ